MQSRFLPFSFFFIFCFLGLAQSSIAQYYLEDRWPNLKFNLPVGMYTAPDQSKRIFILEQTGKIIVFKDSGLVNLSDTSAFLNIRSKMPTGIGGGAEYGLLGMAFHPDFAQNGYVFVNYTKPNSLTTVISRFKVDSLNPNKLKPSSEKVLMQVPQPYSNHNGGSIIFGDDGYLYIALGDGGSGGDPGNRAQNKTDLLGKILRIDVNVPENGPAYGIPPTNPFANNSSGWRKEIATYGMRNPWKITKDPDGPTIWIADVGQNVIEEVDTFRLGANYGWKVMEGNNVYSACGNCDTSNYEKPILAYNRSFGSSITGGYVYRGSQMPKLKGAYIYGDYSSQKVWALKDSAGVYKNTQIYLAGGSLSAFGLDNENEVYSIRYSATGGKLMKIRCGPQTPIISAPIVKTVCTGDSIVLSAPSGAQLSGFKWSNGDTTNRLVFRAVGSYTLQLQSRNAFGCWSYSSESVSIRIRPIPPKPVVADVLGCTGTTVQLPNSYSYIWTNGLATNQISVPSSGSYWIIAKDSSSCRSDSTFFNATIYPKPAAPVISFNGSNLTTFSVAGASYQWLLNGSILQSGTDTSVIPNQNGIYQVILTSALGCKSDTSIAFIITGKLKQEKEVGLLFSPNPFCDFLEFRISDVGSVQRYSLEIYDVKGVLVQRQVVSTTQIGNGFRLITDSLPKGLYTVRAKSASQTITRRMVKN